MGKKTSERPTLKLRVCVICGPVMKKYIVVALSLAAASCFAAPGDSNWAVRLGVIFPRLEGGVSGDTGGTLGIAYRAYKGQSCSLEVEAMGSAYRATSGGDSATFSVSSLNLVGLYSLSSLIQGGGMAVPYIGAVVGVSTPSVSINGVNVDGDTSTSYGPIIGTTLNKQWFIEARYLFCDVPASRGTQIMLGYRF